MSQFDKLLFSLLNGQSDTNFSFSDLVKVLLKLNFAQRIKGSHHIYSKIGVEEILNLQSLGAMAKPYQVKQVREVIVKYGLKAEGNSDE